MAQLRTLTEGNLKRRTIVEVLYSTGIRIGELVSLKKEDIHWEERSIIILNGKRDKDRFIFFTKECQAYLETYLNCRTDTLPYLFLNSYKKGQIDKGSIQYWFISYREQLGFYLSAHTLRHTFAAHLAMKGMPLSSNTSVTRA